MQTLPSGKLPEKTARHDVGTLGRFTKSMAQSRLDSAARQDVAWAWSNSAVPLATATTAADAMSKPVMANRGSPYALQMAWLGNWPQRTAQAQYAPTRSVTQVPTGPVALTALIMPPLPVRTRPLSPTPVVAGAGPVPPDPRRPSGAAAPSRPRPLSVTVERPPHAACVATANTPATHAALPAKCHSFVLCCVAMVQMIAHERNPAASRGNRTETVWARPGTEAS